MYFRLIRYTLVLLLHVHVLYNLQGLLLLLGIHPGLVPVLLPHHPHHCIVTSGLPIPLRPQSLLLVNGEGELGIRLIVDRYCFAGGHTFN